MIIRINRVFTFFCLFGLNCFAVADVIAKESQNTITLVQLPLDVPIIEPAEMPDKIILSKLEGDDEAKNKINTADQLRKKLNNLTFSGSIKDAYDLYDSAAGMANISPDLRARAKLNAAQLYPFANTDDSSYASIVRRKNESLKLFNDVIDDASFSGEMRGWAKYSVAKLYVQNWFDLDPVEAKQKALGLFQDVIADKDVSPNTKIRVKLTLATYYGHMKFNVPAGEAMQKADSLFNEIKKDSGASAMIKAEADFGLSRLKNKDDDPYNTEQLKILKAISFDPAYDASIHAKAKIKIARGLLNGEFDTKPSEAAMMALVLYKEVIAESNQADKPENKLDVMELYAYKHEYAAHLANNAFHQKMVEAKGEAKKLYNELISDVSVFADQKVAVKWQLVRHYLDKKIDPPDGKEAKTAAIDLINEILNDTHVSFELRLILKFNYARLHHMSYLENPLGMSSEQLKDQGLRLLHELMDDSSLSGKQKEMVQAELNMWNGIVKQ